MARYQVAEGGPGGWQGLVAAVGAVAGPGVVLSAVHLAAAAAQPVRETPPTAAARCC